nr:MAG TPA: hypothetical protein [Caudoviricetes sp.]
MYQINYSGITIENNFFSLSQSLLFNQVRYS